MNKNNVNKSQLQMPTNLLGIFAHPDDELVGVGGTLAKNARLGGKSMIVCFGGYTAKRRNELRKACKHAGFDLLILKKDEGTYHHDKHITIKKLKELIRKFKPEFVFTHRGEYDYHIDHRTVYDIVKDTVTVAQSSEQGWFTKGLLLTEGHFLHSRVHVFADVSKDFQTSQEAFAMHKSQIEKNDGYYLKLSEARAKLRGVQAGCKYAEAFQFEPLQLVGSFNRRNLGE